jgi:antitoxin VapB
MDTAKVFTTGRSQAVRLPKQYRFNVDEVFINKIGQAVILTPVSSLAEAFDKGAAMLTEDFLADGIPESISSKREEL